MSAIISGLGAVASAANLLVMSGDVGTDGLRWPAVGFVLAAAAYMCLSSASDFRLARSTLPAPRGFLWLALLMLMLVWLILARGPASRLLLAGVSPAIAALAAASGVSLLVALREKLVLQRPAARGPAAGGMALGAWQCALAAVILLAAIFLETRPLPEVRPWERTSRILGRKPHVTLLGGGPHHRRADFAGPG